MLVKERRLDEKQGSRENVKVADDDPDHDGRAMMINGQPALRIERDVGPDEPVEVIRQGQQKDEGGDGKQPNGPAEAEPGLHPGQEENDQKK